MYIINRLYNCGIFQGAGKTRNYFEGWYFKHVDKAENNILAVIPGISYEKNKNHAFIQVIDGNTCKTHYIRYDIEDFRYSKENFQFSIGDNVFSDKGIRLNAASADISLKGSLEYAHAVKWPSSVASPNSMGWYAFIPMMECYHGVLSMQHKISGSLEINGSAVAFDGGVGYMEKDWGTSFPSSWIWLQSNHFDIDDASFMLSVAKIPWRGSSFIGFIAGLWHKGKLFRFTTYTGAKLEALECSDSKVRLVLADNSRRLSICAVSGTAGTLQAPQKGAMTGHVEESVNGLAEIKLVDSKNGRVVLETKARCCGMETAGRIQELISRP